VAAAATIENGQTALSGSWLCGIDARVKIVSFAILASIAASSQRMEPLLIVFLLALLFAAVLGVPPLFLTLRVWIPAMTLAALLAVPIAVLTPGKTAVSLPFGVDLAGQGLLRAATVILRVLTASTLCCILLLTTPWSTLLKGLRLLRAPAALVAVSMLAFRYAVFLLRIAQEMFEAAESRRVGRLRSADHRRLLAAHIGVLTGKTAAMSESVYLAMASRGYRGEVHIYSRLSMTSRDWVALALVMTGAAVWIALR